MSDDAPPQISGQDKVWTGGMNVTSVDLIAMVVSDAGLASTEPQWWNASPMGCILIGCQPRGGWQVLQRVVQWGDDHWARCFGVDCKLSVLYAYFACSARNRLEVWRSDNFVSPMLAPPENSGLLSTVSSRSEGETKIGEKGDCLGQKSLLADSFDTEMLQGSGWNQIDRGVCGVFEVHRPTNLLDGSQGGQAFICELLRPRSWHVHCTCTTGSRHMPLEAAYETQLAMEIWNVLVLNCFVYQCCAADCRLQSGKYRVRAHVHRIAGFDGGTSWYRSFGSRDLDDTTLEASSWRQVRCKLAREARVQSRLSGSLAVLIGLNSDTPFGRYQFQSTGLS